MKLAAEILVPRGFEFSSATAGIKVSGSPDMALALAPQGANAAAMFTTNRVVAAPLVSGREHLRRTRGRVHAVVVNSGNANCATGEAGRRACEQVCRSVANVAGCEQDEVFPASTGIIGVPLPVDKLIKAIPRLFAARSTAVAGAENFARAIMTTDTRMKTASARFGDATLFGTCKGAGMIHPRLATMMVYLFTDAEASPRELGALLRDSVHVTFNRMNVDTDTSTNDTVLLLASGEAEKVEKKDFAAALQAVCESLAKQIVSDGEGVKHVVNLRIDGARSDAEASQVAKAIGNSMLVKTAWAGADPNWGRVLAAVGYSGVALDPAKVDIFFGKHQVCRRGVTARFDAKKVHAYLTQSVFDVRVALGRGKVGATFWTCDLTSEYVHINADYHT